MSAETICSSSTNLQQQQQQQTSPPLPLNGNSSSSSSSSSSSTLLRVRREPFEYGLLPLPMLIFPDPTTALRELRSKFISSDISEEAAAASAEEEEELGQHLPLSPHHIDADGLAHILDLSDEEALLVLETLTSVLPDTPPFSEKGTPSSSSSSSSAGKPAPVICLDDLILFLYIQGYKKPPIRPHKAAAASVAEVWPSTSAFDRLISTLSPLQVRTGKKNVPAQGDEEAHMLSYVQRHLHALLSLLVDPSIDENADSQVISLEQFNHLGFLLKYEEKDTENVLLSQTAPFFANSDPDMPAAPVTLQVVVDWVLEHVSAAPQQRCKEFGPEREVDDVTMVDACVGIPSLSSTEGSLYVGKEDLTFVDGVSKASILKDEKDINRGSVKVVNCHDSAVYVLAPIKYASIYGCSDSIIVLGAVEKVVRIEHCERVQLIVSSTRICIVNCRECVFYMAVNQKPLILGENHNLQLAPYNTFYPRLEAHLDQVGINPAVNKWDKFLTLGILDPHDSLPHAAGVADAKAEDASLLPPDKYTNFVIPKWDHPDPIEQPITEANPFPLPKAYLAAQQQKNRAVDTLRQTLKTVPIDESKRQDLSQAIHVHFREWLYTSGNIRQLYEFQDADKEA